MSDDDTTGRWCLGLVVVDLCWVEGADSTDSKGHGVRQLSEDMLCVGTLLLPCPHPLHVSGFSRLVNWRERSMKNSSSSSRSCARCVQGSCSRGCSGS